MSLIRYKATLRDALWLTLFANYELFNNDFEVCYLFKN